MRTLDLLHGRLAITILTLAVPAGAALASPDGPDGPRVPSLDELLGLGDAGDEALDPNRRALERRLTAQEAGERFREAVTLMGDAAARIGANDVGIRTQRVQEEILRRLDQVIESARENQGGGGSSSSGSSSQQNQQQPDQSTGPQRPGQQGNGDQENMPPGSTGVETNPALAPDGVTWGNLPERERDAVTQGVNDRYSALYRRLTELYYRRLAEREDER